MNTEYRIRVQGYQSCNLLRRFAAIFYDCLLLASVLFFATLVMFPFTGGNAISNDNIPYKVYLLSLCYLYFSWQWMHGGQTLGMRAWKIRLQQFNGGIITWKTVTLRFLSAIISLLLLGAGFFWSLADEQKLALHDYCSGSCLVKIN